MEGVGVGDVAMSDTDGDETMHDNFQPGAAVVPPEVVSVPGEAAVADDPVVADPVVAVPLVPPAPPALVFMPSQLKELPESLGIRDHGALVNQDVFYLVLKKLGLASNNQIVEMLHTVRAVSRGAAEGVSVVMSDTDYHMQWSTAAQDFYGNIEAFLTPRHVPDAVDPNILRREDQQYITLFDGMREYRTILDVQKKAFRLLLAYFSVQRTTQGPWVDVQTSSSRRHVLLFQVPDAPQIIENAMRYHKADVYLQRIGCRILDVVLEVVLRKLTAEVKPYPPGVKKAFVFPETYPGLHFMQTVIAAMDLAPDDGVLQKYACCALALLSSVKEETLNDPYSTVEYRRSAMASVAGVDTIKKLRKVMIDNATDAHVVTCACRAMSFLLVDATFDATLGGLDGVLIDAMRAHVSNPDIMLFGSRALASFAKVHTDVRQFRSFADCAQFVVNLVQMSVSPTVTEHAIATMEAVLCRKNQSHSCQTLTTEQISEFTRWQQCFLNAGTIRMLVMTMDAISKEGRHRKIHPTLRLYSDEMVQRSLALVLHTLFVMIDDSVDAKMKFLDADGPHMLMCVLTDSNVFKAFLAQRPTTWGPKKLTREGLVWQLFGLLSGVDNCTEKQKCRLRQVSTMMHPGQLHANPSLNPNHIDRRLCILHDKQGLISPIQLAVSWMTVKTTPSTVLVCLLYLCKACTSPLHFTQIGQRIIKPIMLAMDLYLLVPGFSLRQRLNTQIAGIHLLYRASQHMQLGTDKEFMDHIFKPVFPELHENTKFLWCLAKLQRTLANGQMRQAVMESCFAITLDAPTVSAEDKTQAKNYIQHQSRNPYDTQTMTVRIAFHAAPYTDHSRTV